MASWQWEQLTDEDIKQRLTSIKGIGSQTADLILLYSLGRPSIFLAGDYHLKQVIEQLYLEEGDTLKDMLQTLPQKWAPYQSTGSLLLLAWKEQKL
ncbi:MAG: hypothetical protein AAF840_14215 [Bacteroidota bacterium]